MGGRIRIPTRFVFDVQACRVCRMESFPSYFFSLHSKAQACTFLCRVCTCLSRVWVCGCAWWSVCVSIREWVVEYSYAHVCVCVYVHLCVFVSVHGMYMYACVFTSSYIYTMYLCVCVCVCAYVHIRLRTSFACFYANPFFYPQVCSCS